MSLREYGRYLPERATAGDPRGVKLRRAVREAGDGECAICRRLEDDARAHVHWLAYQGLSDPALYTRLRSSKGFCPRHTRLLYSAVTGKTFNLSGIAAVMRVLIAEDLAALVRVGAVSGRAGTARGRAGGVRGRAGAAARKLAAALRPSAPCPECEWETETVALTARGFAEALDEAPFAKLYAGSAGGLCRRHLLDVLGHVRSGEALALVVEHHAEGLRRDDAALAEFLRKKDYRFADEEKAAEQEAPRRSVGRFIGTWP